MGSFASRQNAGVEEVDIGVNHAYRYPPSSGNYFCSHFIMGGERFDTAQPENYLFGENMDLNFLGSRPSPFPYPAPNGNEPSKTLKALINIRKESLRFVRASEEVIAKERPEGTSSSLFNIEFTFDCDVRCAISIMYFCTEEVTLNCLMYSPRDPTMNSEVYHYKRGASQQFSQVSHIFDPSSYPEEDLTYSYDKEVMPVVIQCTAEEGEEPRQSHVTIAIVEKHSDGFAIKALKQKLFVDGLSYLLQEIYGIENKSADNSKVIAEDEVEDNGAECVICMSDLRDTLILPCRHLCLCNCCADSLRYQANNCPICRAPFRALLQIKALQKATSTGSSQGAVEALNGPSGVQQQQPAPPFQDMYIQLSQNASDGTTDEEGQIVLHGEKPELNIDGEDQDSELRMQDQNITVIPINEDKGECVTESSPTKDKILKKLSKEKDSMKIINEKKMVDPTEIHSLLQGELVEDINIISSNKNATPVEEICMAVSYCETETPMGEDKFEKIETKIENFQDETVLGIEKDSSIELKQQHSRKKKAKARYSCQPNTSPSKHGHSSDIATHEHSHAAESLSMPGTPLSNASAVSRSSDASVSSASSTKALLSYLGESSPGSIV